MFSKVFWVFKLPLDINILEIGKRQKKKRFAQRRDNIAGCWPLEAGYRETSNMARKSAHVDEDSCGSE